MRFLLRASSMAWGRACRGSASRTNLRVSSPVPLTGLWQPAGAAGGGTAPMPRAGRRSAARGLSPGPERSRWAERRNRPCLPDAGARHIRKVPTVDHSFLLASDFGNAFRSINIEDFHDVSF